MTATLVYKGQLRCEVLHNQSGTLIETDAPTDNMGKGEKFSPTDLVTVALASCMVTTMAMRCENKTLPFENTKASIQKIMSSDAPRRIVAINIVIDFAEAFKATEEEKEQLVRIARSCPVEKSIHPDIKVDVVFNWG